MTVDAQSMFHIGIRVPDIGVAMVELGASMGVTWAEARVMPEQMLWTPSDGLHAVELKYVYSAEGPQHLELLEGTPGSFWDGREHPGAHHIGMWSDDVAGETAALLDDGWTLVGASRDPTDGEGYGMFTYLQPPSGLIVELVDRAVLPFFQQWWNAALTS